MSDEPDSQSPLVVEEPQEARRTWSMCTSFLNLFMCICIPIGISVYMSRPAYEGVNTSPEPIHTLSPDSTAKSMTTLHALLKELLQPSWNGWSDFSQEFNDLTFEVLKSNDHIEVVPLTRYELQGFVGKMLSIPWKYVQHSSDVFYVPMTVIELLQRTSEAVHKQKDDEKTRQEADLKEMIKSLQERLDVAEGQMKEMMTFPDTNKGIVITSGALLGNEYVAPENGFISGSVRVIDGNNHFFTFVNGKEFLFPVYGGGNHMSFFIPIHKGDVFKLAGGTHHWVAFIPCRVPE